MKLHEIRMVVDFGHDHGHGFAVCGCGKTFAWVASTKVVVCPSCGASLLVTPGSAVDRRQVKLLSAADGRGTAFCTACSEQFTFAVLTETNMRRQGPQLELVCPHCGAT